MHPRLGIHIAMYIMMVQEIHCITFNFCNVRMMKDCDPCMHIYRLIYIFNTRIYIYIHVFIYNTFTPQIKENRAYVIMYNTYSTPKTV